MSSQSNTSNKFRSPLRALELPLLRQLCEFHPWPLTRLCESVGMEKSVLSNVLAGRRPLPTRHAAAFLSLVGMLPDGTLNPKHCFVFKQRVGREEELAALVQKLFPNGGACINLSNKWINRGKALNSDPVQGDALWDGFFAAVLRYDDSPDSEDIKLRSKWVVHGIDESAEVFLSDLVLPTHSDVLAAFASTDFAPPITWAEVEDFALRHGLSPTAVMDVLAGMFSDQKSGEVASLLQNDRELT